VKTEFPRLVETLVRGGVDFVVIGGVAAVAYGHARLTQDLDVSPRAISMTLFGNYLKVIALDDLERAKRAAGRPQDVFDLEAIRIIGQQR
jgi:hypothetical protein